MSDIVCLPTAGLIGRPDKSLWLTNDLNFIMPVVIMSLTTVQCIDELLLVGRPINLLASTNFFPLVGRFFFSRQRDSSARGTGPLDYRMKQNKSNCKSMRYINWF